MKTFSPRNGWKKGDRVEVNERYIQINPRSIARRGRIRNFGIGTMIYVDFDELKCPLQLDERLIRRIDMKQNNAIGLLERPRAIAACTVLLMTARDDLRRCGAKKAAAYVARALKSIEGARRHAEHRANEFAAKGEATEA